MRLGIFGGTFDPIHFGHLRAAEEIREQLRLDKVVLVPAGMPPHRPVPHATAAQRLAMVRLAAQGNSHLEVSDVEIRRRGKSYTVDTLETFKQMYSGAERHLILGADQVAELLHWHEPHRLVQLCRLVAITRPGHPPAGPSRIAGRAIRWVRISALDISATDIRRRRAAGRSIRYLMPEPVLAYIRSRGLYR